MNTIFDKTTRDELVKRINSLNEDCTAQWGKMNVKQMVKHCTMWEEVVLGKRKIKVPLLGRLLGKFFLRQMIKDENPLKRSACS